MKQPAIGAGLAISAALLCAGCDDFVGMGSAKQDFHYSYSLTPGGTLDLSNRNGSIEITGWDRNVIDVSGTKYAPTEERLSDVHISVNVSGNHASVTTEGTDFGWGGSYGVHYSIRVPRKIEFGQVRTTNGSFTIEDVSGGGRVNTTNGRISLERDTGDFVAETTNGSVDIEECNGNERAQTTNGAVRGRLASGAIEAHSTNGSIDLTLLKPPEDRSVRLGTTNGGITLSLAEFHNNSIDANTTHGGITLRLPKDVNARISAHAGVSHVTVDDLSLTSIENQSKHELTGQFGKGGPSIDLSTTTGSVRIEPY